MENGPMIEAEGLAKHYGKTRALAGVGFAVPAGTILGLLGPNGAGKTTAVRILTTLALPDAGRATVAGIDVVKHPGQVRRYLGVAAQDATLDSLLTGRQNLVITGELSGMRRAASQTRAAELLAQFDLTDAADRVVKGYSGGMRRRLDLAASLMTRPPDDPVRAGPRGHDGVAGVRGPRPERQRGGGHPLRRPGAGDDPAAGRAAARLPLGGPVCQRVCR
jgi:ABC-type multidrug transport system ATPase subunit